MTRSDDSTEFFMSYSLHVPHNGPLQRSGHDKVHALNHYAGFEVGGYAPHARRAAAERDRWAAQQRSACDITCFLLRRCLSSHPSLRRKRARHREEEPE